VKKNDYTPVKKKKRIKRKASIEIKKKYSKEFTLKTK